MSRSKRLNESQVTSSFPHVDAELIAFILLLLSSYFFYHLLTSSIFFYLLLSSSNFIKLPPAYVQELFWVFEFTYVRGRKVS